MKRIFTPDEIEQTKTTQKILNRIYSNNLSTCGNDTISKWETFSKNHASSSKNLSSEEYGEVINILADLMQETHCTIRALSIWKATIKTSPQQQQIILNQTNALRAVSDAIKKYLND